MTCCEIAPEPRKGDLHQNVICIRMQFASECNLHQNAICIRMRFVPDCDLHQNVTANVICIRMRLQM